MKADTRSVREMLMATLAPALPRGLAPGPLIWGLAFMGLVLSMIALSSQPWALTDALPHGHTAAYDFIYRVLDPTALYLISGFFTFFLLVRPRGEPVWPSAWRLVLQRLLHAFILFGLATALMYGMEYALKRGLARARPVAHIEHSLIAARIEGWLKDGQAAELRGDQFECPVGRVIFNPTFHRADGPLVDQLVQKTRLSRAEATAHVREIQRRVGIGPSEMDITQQIASFKEIAPWRQKDIVPFLSNGFSTNRCDVNGSAPSGHLLRQSFVLFVFLLIAFQQGGLSLYRWSAQWKLLLSLQAFALLVSAWSRVYSYEHTWSDELISFALTIGLLSVARLVQGTALAFQRTLLRDMLSTEMIELFQSVRLLVAITDRKEKILIWNQEAERITGYRKDEITTLADYVEHLYPDEDQHLILERKRRAMAGPHQERNVITLITTKSRERKIIVWNSATIPAPDGSVFGKFSIGMEMSNFDRRLADLGAGALSILHDMRREVGKLRLRIGPRPTPEVAAIVDRLWNICEDSRSYAKGDSTKESIRADDLVGFAMQILGDDAAAANVVLRKYIPTDIPLIYGRYQLLRHALVDLVHNAIRAIRGMERGTHDDPLEVWITARHVRKDLAEYVELEVADEGPGLPPSLKTWFPPGPIYDGRNDDERELGLGLLLASIAAREHGGWLGHREEDGRNIISITLPVFPQSNQQFTNSPSLHIEI